MPPPHHSLSPLEAVKAALEHIIVAPEHWVGSDQPYWVGVPMPSFIRPV